MALPNHLVLIPDGNRRWAKAKHLPSFMGHQAGADAAEKVFEAALNAGVKNLTFWGASIANVTKREAAEVAFLYELFERYFKKLLKAKALTENKVRVRVIGFWERYFPESLKRAIRDLEAATAEHNERHMTFLLAYSGTDEMLEAISGLVKEGGDLPVTSERLKQHLLTKDLPPVDLVIRTGTEDDPHLSAGFMMWDTAEAQLYFTNVNWPDFSPAELTKALNDYSERERRLGR